MTTRKDAAAAVIQAAREMRDDHGVSWDLHQALETFDATPPDAAP